MENNLGCGTGGQTMLLAQHLSGTIIGLDMFPNFIDVLNKNAKSRNPENRVTGVIGDMEHLPFENHSLDLIWSEGAIDNIGFEKGLSHWHSFLKMGGCLTVTCPSWLTEERPAVVDVFWSNAGSKLDSTAANIKIMQKYAENDTMEAFAAENQYEVNLYQKYKQYYGYVFYIGRAIC
ncbi:class I SAM-dependent methyltransferase [bacterium 1XD21-13]|nr:class I SAM-dependent methyltransferase [bacterium 1XD21-13]